MLYENKAIQKNDVHPVETKIAEVTVEVTNEGTATIDDLNTIFLETNKTVQRSIGTQCEVSLQNTDGEVIAYMGAMPDTEHPLHG